MHFSVLSMIQVRFVTFAFVFEDTSMGFKSRLRENGY